MTPDSRIPFPMDRRAKWLTVLFLAVGIGTVGVLYYLSSGSYLPAWFTTLAIALMLLAVLSIPRFMRVSPHSIEIHCVMELAKIPLQDIRYIRILRPSGMRRCIPIWGIYGFFGYYGYYLHLRKRKIFRVYAREWRNFVLIEDIYEDQIVVSCPDPKAFVQLIEQFRK